MEFYLQLVYNRVVKLHQTTLSINVFLFSFQDKRESSNKEQLVDPKLYFWSFAIWPCQYIFVFSVSIDHIRDSKKRNFILNFKTKQLTWCRNYQRKDRVKLMLSLYIPFLGPMSSQNGRKYIMFYSQANWYSLVIRKSLGKP